ncbi:N-acetylmuramoyl-L-alanine amidase [Thermoactinomyces sp. DSM 45892]|uniref:peptidoglycan recognition protein family protein n=1 Tax=Thermoactinomyces sp. DSM 45892 TaxID=1882753 RepID=UPI000896A247|nr:N-acetylmuramoyl-L-alanine amidase [Thermoactinomyces sp. DSM 45892]SDY85030.1 Peptidoglycan-binding (PGRP) domain of peptidoglycan hydrolases-containing protein [Thermoactinomyces sp. DSM 45892]
MAWTYGKLFNSASDFLSYLNDNLRATITETHVHHTAAPNHANWNSDVKKHGAGAYLARQNSMRSHHMNVRGFSDIAQHITIYPDGNIMTGRNPNIPPASATGYNDSDPDNKHPFMFEMVGNFDKGHDVLQGSQLQSAVEVCRYLLGKGARIRFHRQCTINGKAPKTCPGTGVDYDWFVGLCRSGTTIPATSPSTPTTSGSSAPRTLRYKSPMMRGEDVVRLQKLLGIKADGLFGPDTDKAVRYFQRSKGLAVDGIVGARTRAALNGVKKTSLKYPGTILKEGSRGGYVKMIQSKLGVRADGIFGPKTEAAVKSFQRRKGLSVDGKVGPKTWAAMF